MICPTERDFASCSDRLMGESELNLDEAQRAISIICSSIDLHVPRSPGDGLPPFLEEFAGLRSQQLCLLAQIRLIRQLDAILERGACAPAQFGETADIEQFAGRAVGP